MNFKNYILIGLLVIFHYNTFSQTKWPNPDCIHPMDTIDNMDVYTIAHVMPGFIGEDVEFMNFIHKNISYHEFSNTDQLQFTVYVTFIIDTLGRVRNPCIWKPLNNDSLTTLETEVLRVISMMPNWIPGYLNNTKVAVRIFTPFKFDYAY